MVQHKTYKIMLTTVDPMRIGGKSDPLSEAENPVAIVGGRVCIPGSSLKGAYRTAIERWLNENYFDEAQSWWTQDTLKPCIPATRLSEDERALVQRGRFRQRACTYGPQDRRRQDRAGTGDSPTICPVCYLLGAQGLVGFVQVPFLFAAVPFEQLYSARLERTSQTVMKGTNRAYQLIPPDTRFTGVMEVLLKDDLLGWELGKPRPLREVPDADRWLQGDNGWNQTQVLKELIEDRITKIDRIGGYRSKGFGRVSISIEPTTGE